MGFQSQPSGGFGIFSIETNQLGRIGKLHSAKQELAELDAFLAARLSACALFKMFRHDSFSVWTVVVIVIDLTVPRRFFDGVGMVRSHLRH